MSHPDAKGHLLRLDEKQRDVPKHWFIDALGMRPGDALHEQINSIFCTLDLSVSTNACRLGNRQYATNTNSLLRQLFALKGSHAKQVWFTLRVFHIALLFFKLLIAT